MASFWWIGLVFLGISLAIWGGIAWRVWQWEHDGAAPSAQRGRVIYGWETRKSHQRRIHK